MAISPQVPERNREVVLEGALAFPVLADAGNAVAREFGLAFELPPDLRAVYQGFGLDLAAFNGDASWTLPMPARYVIDRDSLVRYARVDPDYTRRPEPEETLRFLEETSRPR